MNEQEIRTLITRIVTGDGEQAENIAMTEAEWAESIGSDEQVSIEMHKDDWMALVRIAREASK